MALDRARVLLGCYANAKPHDPKTYLMAIAGVLAGYPMEVVMQVTDPRQSSCIQRRSKWLPEVSEVATACDAALASMQAALLRTHYDEKARIERAKEAERMAVIEQSRPVVEAKVRAWREQVGPIEKKKGWGSLGAKLIPHIIGSEK